MVKNGLFLCSIGFLIILYALNPSSMEYDFRSLATGLVLVAIGGYLFFKGSKKEKREDGTKK